MTVEGTMRPAVSMILPVYNVEPYLRECLESVVRQTLINIEIICVNDGSTDGSPAILEEYRKRDPRITVINQENMGLSAARNRGMRRANGEFICFLDCDDFLEPETLDKTVPFMEKDDLDVLIFERDVLYETEELKLVFPQSGKRAEKCMDVCSGVRYLKDAKDSGIYNTTVWGKIWRRSFLLEHALFFREGIIHEDVLFCFLAFMAAERVQHIPDVLYHRRVRPDSIMTCQRSHENVLGMFGCAEGILAYAMSGVHSPMEEQEIRRAYVSLINATKHCYTALSPQEKRKVVFQNEILSELFRQIVLSSIQVEDLKGRLQRISPLKDFQESDIVVTQNGNKLTLTNSFCAVPVQYAWYIYKGDEIILREMYTKENSNCFSYCFTEPGTYKMIAFVRLLDKSDTKSLQAVSIKVEASGLVWEKTGSK